MFIGLKSEVWFRRDAEVKQPVFHFPSAEGKVAGVLGAGNVSAIPATDMLYKLFYDKQAVLLKLNPVNDYLHSIFEELFQPLIEADLLRIVSGGANVGKEIVQNPGIDTLHITGSQLTHDAIVWGTDESERTERKRSATPLVNKPITSELGNVTPWIVVPGKYSKRQLQFQARHIASSIVNNASFNCLATKMIVTSAGWSQRAEFLDLVDLELANVRPRFAYYPGALDRFRRFTGINLAEPADGQLPWTLIRDAKIETTPHLFREESFVCVCAETTLEESSPTRFLKAAVRFANEELFGTLCATLTVTNEFRQQQLVELETAIEQMRYGSVCINQWSGVVYGLMSPPWGGHASATLESPESGLGHVHNVFGLQDFDKSVLWGPLCNWPKPVWFHSHRTAYQAGLELIRFYTRPSVFQLPKLFFLALRG